MEDFFKAFFPIPLGLVLAAALFLELAAWKASRVTVALRGEKGLRLLCADRLDRWGQMLFWSGACLEDVVGGRHPLFVATFMGCGAAGLLATFCLWWFGSWGNNPDPLQVSRGALFDGVGAVRRKAGMSCVLNIYVPPEGFQARSADSENWASVRSIFIPRRLLDWMSRAEIDALVAFQLTSRQRVRYVKWITLGAFISGVIASAALNWLKKGPQGRWEAFLLLLVTEITALTFLVPHLRYLADRRAIEISGDPEAYLSAMAELSRLGTGVPDAKFVRRIARTAGVTPDRIQQLQEQPRPSEDRYPTSGDYLAVGF
jgi:hypothetical protein